MTCRANRTANQKQIQSKMQAKISILNKQGIGRPRAWRPTLDARGTGVQHRPKETAKQKHTDDEQNIEACIQATVSRHKLGLQAEDIKKKEETTSATRARHKAQPERWVAWSARRDG